jgi:hypothetical protein
MTLICQRALCLLGAGLQRGIVTDSDEAYFAKLVTEPLACFRSLKSKAFSPQPLYLLLLLGERGGLLLDQVGRVVSCIIRWVRCPIAEV